MPVMLRRFILATGPRGLGMEYVEKIRSWRKFEELWYMQGRVLLWDNGDEGRKEINADIAIRNAIEFEEHPDQPVIVIDPGV